MGRKNGQQTYDCPDCDGGGIVIVERAGGTETVPCRTCQGSGQLVGGPA